MDKQKKLHVIVKRQNVLNFIVIVLESIKHVKAVIVWAVIIYKNMQIKEVMLFLFSWIEIQILSVLKYKLINIQKDVIVKNLIVSKNIANVIRLGLDVVKIVNVNNAKITMINNNPKIKENLLSQMKNKINKYKIIDSKYLLLFL
jgi:hypothetical protein